MREAFCTKRSGDSLSGIEASGSRISIARALRSELGEVADAVFDEHERAMPPLNPQVWRLDREIRKLLLEQVLDYELEIQEKARAKERAPCFLRARVWDAGRRSRSAFD